jgi:hypothetical protein
LRALSTPRKASQLLGDIGTGVGSGCLVTEIAVPNNAVGWAIVARDRDYHEHSVLSAAVPALHSAGVATLTLELPHAAAAAAARVRDAVASVRDELAGELPVAYLATGRAATAGWAASLGGELAGVLAWNPAVRGAWSVAKRVGVPSLVMVDPAGVNSRLQLVSASALGRVLGDAQIELAQGDSEVDGGVLAAWYWHRIVCRSRFRGPRAAGVAGSARVSPGLASPWRSRCRPWARSPRRRRAP